MLYAILFSIVSLDLVFVLSLHHFYRRLFYFNFLFWACFLILLVKRVVIRMVVVVDILYSFCLAGWKISILFLYKIGRKVRILSPFIFLILRLLLFLFDLLIFVRSNFWRLWMIGFLFLMIWDRFIQFSFTLLDVQFLLALSIYEYI